MSGRRQHFIPQMFLRGFGTTSKDETHVKVFRFPATCFKANVDKVAVESEFYSKFELIDNEENLDSIITRYENTFSNNLKYLTEIDKSIAVDAKISAEFVTHLITRNDHFRKATASAAKSAIEKFHRLARKEGSARKLFGVGDRSPDSFINKEIKKILVEKSEQLRGFGLSDTELENFISDHINQNFSAFHKELLTESEEAFDFIQKEIDSICAGAQKSALIENLIPELRVQKLEEFNWEIVITDIDIIMPDCIAVAISKIDGILPIIMSEDKEIEKILVPIQTKSLLVGSREGSNIMVDLKYLNVHLARCSWDFFVCGIDVTLKPTVRNQIRKSVTKKIDNIVAGLKV